MLPFVDGNPEPYKSVDVDASPDNQEEALSSSVGRSDRVDKKYMMAYRSVHRSFHSRGEELLKRQKDSSEGLL